MQLPVSNFDNIVEQEKNTKRHGDLLPSSIRAIFCRPFNCGKTNSLLALITHPNGIRYENIYAYTKSLNQPKYKFLQKLIELEGVQYFPYSEHDEVITPENALPNSIIIFDDIACEKQNHVKAFFCMGRHKNVDCFYLCQSNAHIPKHLVRDNVNLLVFFRQDDINLKHLYEDHVNSAMTFTQFKDFCVKCWRDEKYGFLMIDKDSSINGGRYRKDFDCFAINIYF